MVRVDRSFPCGVVEGFYGTPWPHSARLSMVRFLGENDFNTYVYSPKADRYLRSSWRKAHPRRSMERLRELVREGNRSSVEFVFAVSPGLDITYSSRSDRRLLMNKLLSVSGMGCTRVGVFLDDIETRLVHPQDRRDFRSLARGQVYLLNHVFDELAKGGVSLIFCPTYYANEYLGKKASQNAYLKEIGAGLAGKIDIMWTGRRVVSTEITEGDVHEFAQVIRRKPFLWDNYPVNDYYRSEDPALDRRRFNIGPFEGRAPGILPKLTGYVANPMNEAEASKIPLLTLRDFLKAPSRYSPSASFARATEIAFSGTEPYDDIELLAECSRATPFHPREAGELRRTARRLMRSSSEAGREGSPPLSAEFRSELMALLGLKDELRGRRKNEALLKELEPLFAKIEALAELGLAAIALATALKQSHSKTAASRLRARVRRKLELAKANRVEALGEFVVGPSASGIGLPRHRQESPVVTFSRWSLEI